MLYKKEKSKRPLTTYSDFTELFKLSMQNVHKKATKNADNSKLNQLNNYFGELHIADIQHVDIIRWTAHAEEKNDTKTKR